MNNHNSTTVVNMVYPFLNNMDLPKRVGIFQSHGEPSNITHGFGSLDFGNADLVIRIMSGVEPVYGIQVRYGVVIREFNEVGIYNFGKEVKAYFVKQTMDAEWERMTRWMQKETYIGDVGAHARPMITHEDFANRYVLWGFDPESRDATLKNIAMLQKKQWLHGDDMSKFVIDPKFSRI